jgi:hypothetical protein
VSYEQGLAYDRKDLSQLLKAFKAMDAEATKVAAETGYELSKFTAGKLKAQALPAHLTTKQPEELLMEYQSRAPQRLVSYPTALRVSRFSGGGSTRSLWAGFEFGSSIKLRKDGKVRRLNQFPTYSGRFGKGSRGWFIYPTLRALQPELVKKWEQKFADILKIWGK